MASKRMDINEFRTEGYLQEVNRRLFHPLGLALEIMVENDGTARLSGIWDYRDDPEGLYFGEDGPESEKTASVALLESLRRQPRIEALGYWIQPVVEKTRTEPHED